MHSYIHTSVLNLLLQKIGELGQQCWRYMLNADLVLWQGQHGSGERDGNFLGNVTPIPLKVAKNSLTLDEKQQSLTKPIQLTITKHSPTSAGAIRLETEPQSWSSCSFQNWWGWGCLRT